MDTTVIQSREAQPTAHFISFHLISLNVIECFQGPDPKLLRMQSGIVFEWDEETRQCDVVTIHAIALACLGYVTSQEAGEGFIIPSEEQVWLLLGST